MKKNKTGFVLVLIIFPIIETFSESNNEGSIKLYFGEVGNRGGNLVGKFGCYKSF